MYYFEILWDSLFGWIPSVVSAILLLALALILALVAKRIVKKLFNKLNLEKHTDKIGLSEDELEGTIGFIGNLTFLIVFLLFLPGVLDNLGMSNVALPITSLASRFLDYIPNIIAAVVILAVGLFVAKLVRQLITAVLKKLNLDKIQDKVGISTDESTTISSVLAYIVYVLILIPIITAALEALSISAISIPAVNMLNQILSFLPFVFAAIIILIIGIFIARIVGKLLQRYCPPLGPTS